MAKAEIVSAQASGQLQFWLNWIPSSVRNDSNGMETLRNLVIRHKTHQLIQWNLHGPNKVIQKERRPEDENVRHNTMKLYGTFEVCPV